MKEESGAQGWPLDRTYQRWVDRCFTPALPFAAAGASDDPFCEPSAMTR